MCDTGRCPSEAGSGCSTSAGDCPDGMLAVLDEFQRLYQERLERINANPAAPCYSKDKMELLEDWIDDLNQQNRTLVETVKELETEASQRCELLESRLVSTTSSTKQYMLQLHQLQRQIQQLVSGRAQAQGRLDEVTALLQDSTDENLQLRQRLEMCSCDSRRVPGDTTDRWQHNTGRSSATAGSDVIVPSYSHNVTGVQGDVTGRLHKLESDLEAALHEKDDLQEILGVRQCELEENQQEVVRLQAELSRLRVTLGAERGPLSGARRQLEPPAEVHRLQKHCRDLIDQRNAALAQLAEVKVTLMEVMERQARGEEEGEHTTTAAESATSETETAAEQEVRKPVEQEVRKPVEQEVRKPPPAPAVNRQPLQSTANQRLQNQLEERDQLVSALQAHLASARNEVALKDETLARLESKLETTRQELSGTGERLAGAEGERDALAQQNQILAKQVRELQLRAEEAQAVSRRLESEADLQMAQITDLQERLLAAETSGKQLTASCVEKDVQIGQQWTTINSLKEALLEAKQQLAALQPAPSYLGGLIAGAVRRDVRDV